MKLREILTDIHSLEEELLAFERKFRPPHAILRIHETPATH
ncbi:MAG: hypothetical protein U1F70_16710 [Candidatus Competibacteraceae bacterium]